MIRTLIINSQKQEREKISSLLSEEKEIKILGFGKDGYDALKLAGCHKPDVIILDNQLDYIKGGEIVPLLRVRSPQTLAVILTSEINDYDLYTAAVNRVSGFILKTDIEKLPHILECVTQGGRYISPALGARILDLLSAVTRKTAEAHSALPVRDDPTGYLSKKELSILTYIGKGKSSVEIAENLHLATGTVRNYVSSVMRKTGMASRSQLASYACNYGLVPVLRQVHCQIPKKNIQWENKEPINSRMPVNL